MRTTGYRFCSFFAVVVAAVVEKKKGMENSTRILGNIGIKGNYKTTCFPMIYVSPYILGSCVFPKHAFF